MVSLLVFVFEIFHIVLGMSSNHRSTSVIESVPAFCTHRPSLLPIGLSCKFLVSVSFETTKNSQV